MENYKPNSHLSKETPDDIPVKKDKVISGSASIKKKGFLKTLAGYFMSSEPVDVKDVLITSAKTTFLDVINTIFGVGPRRRSGGSIGDKVSFRSYGSYYGDPAPDRRPQRQLPRAVLDYDSIVVESKGDAELVLDKLTDLIREYGKAKVSDLYEFCELSCDYTCENYGWFDLSTARTVRLRDGRYSFDLPRVEPLK